MAGLDVAARTSADVATGTSAKTVYQYTAPANTGARAKRISITGDSTSTTAAKGLVEVIRGATGGTATTDNPVKLHGHTGSVQGTARRDFTVEPTGGTVADRAKVNPYGGHVFTKEHLLNPGETLGVRTTFGTSINVTVSEDVEE